MLKELEDGLATKYFPFSHDLNIHDGFSKRGIITLIVFL